jgi:hypothetical protein
VRAERDVYLQSLFRKFDRKRKDAQEVKLLAQDHTASKKQM